MDNDDNKFEELLREYTPKKPSHGARWNLGQRLIDLERPDVPSGLQRRSPLIYAISSAAATVLVAITIWALVLRPEVPSTQDALIVPPAPAPDATRLAGTPRSEAATATLPEPILVGDEKGVPSVISMKKHITDVQDAGVVHLPDRPPMRRVRQDYINEVQIRDPDTGKVYRVHKPGSETIYIKLDDY